MSLEVIDHFFVEKLFVSQRITEMKRDEQRVDGIGRREMLGLPHPPMIHDQLDL